MIRLKALAKRSARVFLRVFPPCSMLSQAIAYNLFLAFFPTLLLIVALATSRWGSQTNLLDLVTDLTKYLPPGSRQIVSEFLIKRAPQAWKWAVLGWAGTLIAGSQVMKLIMEGIHVIYHDNEKPGFLHRQLRGLLLLVAALFSHCRVFSLPHCADCDLSRSPTPGDQFAQRRPRCDRRYAALVAR